MLVLILVALVALVAEAEPRTVWVVGGSRVAVMAAGRNSC
jgi:hypothetical protein